MQVPAPSVPARSFLVSALLILLTGGVLAGTARAGSVNWKEVDEAHRKMQYDRERELLEPLRETMADQVAWLWRMARLDFDQSYQMSDRDDRKQPLLQRGLEFARKALARDEKSAEAHLYYAMIIGQISYYQGNEAKIRVSHEVKKHGLRAIELDPSCASAYHMMGRWHYELADLSWVERTLAETLYGKLPDASIAGAIRNFKAALKIEPENISHRLWLAKSLLENDQDAEARTVLETAVHLQPQDAAGLRDLEEARKLLERLR